jgi:two-component system, chemotaxis family, protein-glutamate methylesterase/glutaminase
VVAVATSAGGLQALSKLLSGLPAEFPAAIAIVLHLDPRRRSMMARILDRQTSLTVKEAEEGDRLRPGMVYTAPPNHHLLVNPDGRLSLSESAVVHFVRPSADTLFESLAASYQDRAIAVVLTGAGIDGSQGLRAIKKMGGTIIVQDQLTSDVFGMPAAAIATGTADFVLPLGEIPAALMTLVTGAPRS